MHDAGRGASTVRRLRSARAGGGGARRAALNEGHVLLLVAVGSGGDHSRCAARALLRCAAALTVRTVWLWLGALRRVRQETE
eukprot:COSAG02_NODE_2270_length_9267_cov_13.803992_6_plen_82_part_00